jgi:hypothetical protein
MWRSVSDSKLSAVNVYILAVRQSHFEFLQNAQGE